MSISEASILARSVGVQLVKCHERYLGLSSLAGKNKKQLFDNVKDRIWNKLKGWWQMLFSIEAKEVLLKAVVQYIPTYSMSLFRIPKGLIKDIHRLCAKFWWGSTDTERKLHWCSWSKLCESKDNGGYGFKDLSLFNQAMLAKQCWRLIKYPNSLAARVIKGRYFPSGNFLEAENCSYGSFIWRSLLRGREIIEVGSRWRIGSRSSVLIYSDMWIPRPFSFKIQSPPVLSMDATVRQLMSPSGGWNIPLVQSSFVSEEADYILSIPIGSSQVHDSLQWHFDKKGNYSVKSGYKVGKMLQNRDSPSGSIDKSWWRDLWRLKTPPKVKGFIWRACHQ
ncbi:hypothetical protein Dsin_005158 [Dipteronia sinensis]|uniref:Reverse transcriptase zinc-binding domain-containing protein n=1 Tax=Dipteronia sinensis TaxID=43782 RepID=A0AAE0AVX3_9ROSI|nr:hypothetical protein Dsin_005158 [Dipteronia sinensis]